MSNFDKCHYIRCLHAEFAAKHTKALSSSLTTRWKISGAWFWPMTWYNRAPTYIAVPLLGPRQTRYIGSTLYLENYPLNPIETYLVSLQKQLNFGPRLPNLGPLVTHKSCKMVVSDHYLQNYSLNPLKSWCIHLLSKCSELIHFWATLAKFRPSSGQKLLENDSKWFSTIIRKNYSLNPNETWCIHLFGESSEMILFWVMLTPFQPPGGS